MPKSLIRKNQLHPDISDLVSGYGLSFFTTPTQILSMNLVLSGDQTISGFKNYIIRPSLSGSGFATTGELSVSGSMLNSKINSLSGYSDGITTNLTLTGQTLNSKINSLSGNNYATAINLASTGSTLDSKINSLSGYGDGAFAAITNLTTTGSTINSRLIDISGTMVGIQTFTGAKTFSGVTYFSTNSGNYISGAYINLQSSPVLSNANATGQAILNIRANSTRTILHQTDGLGASFTYQPGLIERQNISYLFTTGLTNINFNFNSKLRNVTTIPGNIFRPGVSITPNNYYGGMKKLLMTGWATGVGTTGVSFGIAPQSVSDMQFFRGQGVGRDQFGGFYYKTRFALGDMGPSFPGTLRAFIGMSSLVDNLVITGLTSGSTRQTDLLGIGFDSGDSNWFFMHNSGATVSATKFSLGSSYSNLTRSGNVLEFTMYATPNSGVGFYANIANSGTTFGTGYYTTTNIPSGATLLGPNISIGTPELSGAVELALNSIYIESFL